MTKEEIDAAVFALLKKSGIALTRMDILEGVDALSTVEEADEAVARLVRAGVAAGTTLDDRPAFVFIAGAELPAPASERLSTAVRAAREKHAETWLVHA